MCKVKESIAVLATNNEISGLQMNSNQHPRTALIYPPGWDFIKAQTPGARFSKLPVITGPVKLFCFPIQIGVSEGLKIVR